MLETPSSFRLLHIGRSSDDENTPYHYSLHETNFDEVPLPHYETLSYVWGTSDRNELLRLKDGKFLRGRIDVAETFAGRR